MPATDPWGLLPSVLAIQILGLSVQMGQVRKAAANREGVVLEQGYRMRPLDFRWVGSCGHRVADERTAEACCIEGTTGLVSWREGPERMLYPVVRSSALAGLNNSALAVAPQVRPVVAHRSEVPMSAVEVPSTVYTGYENQNYRNHPDVASRFCPSSQHLNGFETSS